MMGGISNIFWRPVVLFQIHDSIDKHCLLSNLNCKHRDEYLKLCVSKTATSGPQSEPWFNFAQAETSLGSGNLHVPGTGHEQASKRERLFFNFKLLWSAYDKLHKSCTLSERCLFGIKRYCCRLKLFWQKEVFENLQEKSKFYIFHFAAATFVKKLKRFKIQ